MPYKNPRDQRAAQQRYNLTAKGKAAQHRQNHQPAAKARRKTYLASDAGKISARKYYFNRRHLVLKHYGGVCACCGEAKIPFLAIDHINGGGNAHRKQLGGANNFYLWLIREKFPSGFRVLCHNCNMATRYGLPCPHKESC